VALAAVGVVAGTVIGLWRQPGAGALDTVWAEDGATFLTEAVDKGPLASLTTSYAGYYHLMPRLLAGLAALLAPDGAAAVLAVGAALLTSLAAVLVFVASSGQLRSAWSRALVSAVVVALPLGQEDLPNSIANLHWVGLYTLFWVLLWTPRGRAGRAVGIATAVLVVGSDILVVALLPLAVARAIRRPPDLGGRRDRYGMTLAAVLASGFVLQVLGLLTGSSSRQLAPDPLRAVSGYALRAVPPGLLGERWVGADVDGHWLALAVVAWLLVLAAAGVALARLTRPEWPLALAAGVHSVALYALPVVLSGIATVRYSAAPAMLLVTALVALLQPGAGWPGRAPLLALTGLICVVGAVNLRLDNPRAHGPRWTESLAQARTQCATRSPADTVEVVIAPAVSEQHSDVTRWVATLPCSYVRR
jgi:hypothetical protein